jgi:chorismate lyase
LNPSNDPAVAAAETPWQSVAATPLVCPAGLSEWLSADGLLTDRIERAAGAAVVVTLLATEPATLGADHRVALAVGHAPAQRRCVTLAAAERLWVYAETLIPLRTLEQHPWLVALGNRALGAALARDPLLERGPLAYARLAAADPAMARRAAAAMACDATAIWARRSWFALGGARLLVQEAFHPRLAATVEAAG